MVMTWDHGFPPIYYKKSAMETEPPPGRRLHFYRRVFHHEVRTAIFWFGYGQYSKVYLDTIIFWKALSAPGFPRVGAGLEE